MVYHDVNSHSNSRGNENRGFAGNGQNSRETVSSSEFTMLSEELSQRITHEMNHLMSSVSSKIQSAISEAIDEQVLAQIQATLRPGQEQVPHKRWEVLERRPGCRSDEAFKRKFRSSSRDELPRDFNRNEETGAQQTFRNINTNNEQFLEDVIIFRRKYVIPNTNRLPNTNGTVWSLTPIQWNYRIF